MKNKVLVKIIVPEIDESFDVFIPVNEVVWKVKKLVSKCIADLTGANFDFSREYVFINPKTSKIYKENDLIINTDIRNASVLVLLSISNNKMDVL
jgi:hypothetical protein